MFNMLKKKKKSKMVCEDCGGEMEEYSLHKLKNNKHAFYCEDCAKKYLKGWEDKNEDEESDVEEDRDIDRDTQQKLKETLKEIETIKKELELAKQNKKQNEIPTQPAPEIPEKNLESPTSLDEKDLPKLQIITENQFLNFRLDKIEATLNEILKRLRV